MSDELQRVKDALANAQGSHIGVRAGAQDVGSLMSDTCGALLAWLAYQVQQQEALEHMSAQIPYRDSDTAV